MSPFSFYIGGSPTTLVVYIAIWVAILLWMILSKSKLNKRIPKDIKCIIMVALAIGIISVTAKVGHRQADLDRQSFDTPTLTDQKEVVVSTRPTSADASKALEVQIEKQREENSK